MKNKKRLALLSLVAIPSLLYSAPASAAEVTEPSKIAYTYNNNYYYNSNVWNVIQLISIIDDRYSSFQTRLESALKAYNNLTETEKQYVTNYDVLSNHQHTRILYRKLASQIEEKLASVEPTAVNYYENVLATREWFNSLNAAQKTFVNAETQRILSSYISPNTTIDKVVTKIQLLNSSRLSFHQEVEAARAEYNALRKFTNAYLPYGTEQLLLEAERLVVKDKAAAKDVENAIAALSPKTSTIKDVQKVKTAFEALTPVQQQIVPNVSILIDFVSGKYKLPTQSVENTKPNFSNIAALPGKTTAMSRNRNDYSAKINVTDPGVHTERFILTTKSNMTLIIPSLSTLVDKDTTGVIEIQLKRKLNNITFKMTLNNKPIEFEENIELIINNLPKNASIIQRNDLGEKLHTNFYVDGNRHIVQATTSGTFQIIRK